MAKSITTDQAKESFFQYLSLCNFSPMTIINYTSSITKFISHLTYLKIHLIQDITFEHVQSFFKARYYYINRKGKPNNPVTRNGEIKVIRVFLSFLEKKELIKDNFANQIKLVKAPELILPKDILTKKEILHIFSLPDKQTVLGYRDRTLLELLYATGIRRLECCRLETQDILFDKQCLLIRLGKGAKDRQVPINNTAFAYLKHYVYHIRPKLLKAKSNIPVLFLTYRGKPFLPCNMGERLSLYFKQTKLNKQISIHSLRHTFATHLLQQGMPVRYVQELLGHQSLDTTFIYLRLTISDLKSEYRKFHPREQRL